MKSSRKYEIGTRKHLLSVIIDLMFVGDSFPELGTDLIAALAGLKMDDLPHFAIKSDFCA